jgi:hypothetical protein
MDALARLGYNVENMSSPLPVMSKIAQSATSLVDNQYNQALQWQKDKAGIQETVARANNIDSVTDYNNQALDYRLKDLDLQNKQRQQSLDLFPLDVQAKQQALKENQFRLQEAQRNADEIDKAHGEYQAWHDELAQLDPTDPDYDNKVAAINAKYPEASTNPSTQRLIAPLIQQQNVKRSQSSLVQQRTDQLNQLRAFQQNGLIPPDTDFQKEVAAGNGQMMINQAKKQAAINRLQAVSAYSNAGDRAWALSTINDMTADPAQPGETRRPMFGPNGDLNPGTEALLSDIERRIGITPVAPGAKKETKVTTDETGTKTETTITGQPVTAQDIAKPTQPTAATTAGMPTKPEDMAKDPIFQSVFSDLAASKLALPGNPKPNTPEYTAGLFAEYAKRWAAAHPQPQPGQEPSPGPQRASKAADVAEEFQPDTSGSQRMNAIYNNPGALGLTDFSRRFGATASGKYDAGHPFAQFPTREAGAAAQFALWQNKDHYLNHSLRDAITTWTGTTGSGEDEFISKQTGIPLDQVITDDFLRSPQGIRLMQAQAQYEGQNVLTLEQWKRAQDWAYKGIKPESRVAKMAGGGLIQASDNAILPGAETAPRQTQNAAKAEILLQPGQENAPYLGGTGKTTGDTKNQIDWHNFNFGPTQSFSGGPGFYNNPGSGKPYDTGDAALVGARVPMSELTRVLGTDADSEKSVISSEVGKGYYQIVVAKKDGTLARIPIVDVTPEGKNRGLELTPGAMKLMGANSGDNLGYKLAFPDGSSIEPSFGGESPIHNWLAQRDVGKRQKAVGSYQPGGLVTGEAGPDQVPAMLTSGEYVVNKDAVQDVGLQTLEALNARGAGSQQLSLSSGSSQDGGLPLQQPSAPSQWPKLPTIRPQLTIPAAQPAPQPTLVSAAPSATPSQTPAVTTGPATRSLASTGGTTMTPQYTTGDAFLNAHYLGNGQLSGLATNFGHDVNGRPDTYMLSKLGGGSRIGAFGTDVVNPTTAGVSIPVQTFKAFIGDPSNKDVRQKVQSGQVQVEVTAPNGKKGMFPIVDLGPGKGEHASLDMTGTAMRQLGMNDNFGALYRIVSY